jgi:hypothetical protein
MSDQSVSVIEFINANNLYANTMYYYVNPKCGKKYLLSGELNNRTIPQVIEYNKNLIKNPVKEKLNFPLLKHNPYTRSIRLIYL